MTDPNEPNEPTEMMAKKTHKEIDHYYERASQPKTDDAIVLDYWKGNSNHMPQLANLARKIFHVPLSSVTSYRSSSTGETVYTESTTLLDSDRAAEIIYCKENYFRLQPLMTSWRLEEKEFESEYEEYPGNCYVEFSKKFQKETEEKTQKPGY